MRFPTQLGLLDIGLLIFSIVMIGLIATTEVKLDDSYLPTAINGISTVTGILVGLVSGLIVFTVTQLTRFHLEKYKDRLLLYLMLLIFSAMTLLNSYADLIRSSLASSVRSAMIGLYVVFVTLLEFVFFLSTRILEDIERQRKSELK